MNSVLLLTLLTLTTFAYAALFSNALGDHMVLQRAPQRASVWGFSRPGDIITVTFNNKKYQASSGSIGVWQLYLDPTPAGGPYTIEATSTFGLAETLSDVLFGDVYVCGGQSNMQFTVDQAFNNTKEVAAANDFPDIRVMTVGQSTYSSIPLQEFKKVDHPWIPASSQSIGVGNWSSFSAVCWFFGRDLYNHLDGKVPIGLLSDNWGGTPVQAWSSPDASKVCNLTLTARAGNQNDPNVLWNAMIVPILDMTIKGALWYQGEANSYQPDYYACAFPEMIKDWRSKWNSETDPLFPFFFVQLAPWLDANVVNEPELRGSQLEACEYQNVGFAVSADLGDPTSPFGSIHPRDKQPVGQRLLKNAQAFAYGEKDVQYLGPWAKDWSTVSAGPKSATARISFYADSIGSGLTFKAKTCLDKVPAKECSGFKLQSKSGKWFQATATIVGNDVEVIANLDVPGINATSYGWNNYPLMTLWNADGLPATPFFFPNPYPVNRPSTE